MGKLIMMRHGQSKWNELNLFTGWVDIPLSGQGIEEAVAGGKQIKDIPIDLIFTSSLIRAIMTAMIAMNYHSSGKVPVILHPDEGNMESWARIYSLAAEQQCVPVIRAWELNERMYGELQGLNKDETIEKFGAEQVKIWRRSYAICPPNGESLELTAARSIPYFENVILPRLQEGKNVFISAHGNSLRSIIMSLDQLTAEQIVQLEIPTGVPIIYEYQQGIFKKLVI